MYQLQNNFSLRGHNTFGLPAVAKHFLTVDSPQDLIQYFGKNKNAGDEKRVFLGAGSNLLFVHDYDGLVIHPLIGGIKVVTENRYHVEVEAGAGVTWDHFVAWCVEKGWHGVENLSLIPGNVGAVPVQNIGAYGVEAASVIATVNGIDLVSFENRSLNREDCQFGYRTSLFKEKLKEQFMVTSVVFRLSKQPGYKIKYEGLEAKIHQFGETNLMNVRKAIIAIRESKLPDPSQVGNAGSFFKNPLISEEKGKELKDLYPEIPLYFIGTGVVKVAAGWLIEKSGWRGKSAGNAAVHDKQALVIINKGGATGEEILRLSEMVVEDVFLKFNIRLEREVQVV